jgi:hypothetical protein
MRWGVNSEVQVGKNESVTRVCTSATQNSPQSDANSRADTTSTVMADKSCCFVILFAVKEINCLFTALGITQSWRYQDKSIKRINFCRPYFRIVFTIHISEWFNWFNQE